MLQLLFFFDYFPLFPHLFVVGRIVYEFRPRKHNICGRSHYYLVKTKKRNETEWNRISFCALFSAFVIWNPMNAVICEECVRCVCAYAASENLISSRSGWMSEMDEASKLPISSIFDLILFFSLRLNRTECTLHVMLCQLVGRWVNKSSIQRIVPHFIRRSRRLIHFQVQVSNGLDNDSNTIPSGCLIANTKCPSFICDRIATTAKL